MKMRQRGFSIVEFMIAMTIGLFLLSGLTYLIAQTSSSRAEIERASRQIENGRYALDRISEDLRHAGYFGEYYDLPTSGTGFPATLADANPCENAVANLPNGMPLAVMGYDGDATPPIVGTVSLPTVCISDADYKPGTDVLVVRRASTTAQTGGFVSATAYIQTNPTAYLINTGSNSGSFTLTVPKTNSSATDPAPIRKYLVHIYYVAKCNRPAGGYSSTCNGTTDDGGESIPTLRMIEMSGGSMQTQAVAEGIEHLQVDYGKDTDGDGVADSYGMCDSTTPCSTTDFRNMVSVQVNVVARNTERSLGYSDTKTYSLGLKGYTTAANDSFRRHSYSGVVRLTNLSMRREQ